MIGVTYHGMNSRDVSPEAQPGDPTDRPLTVDEVAGLLRVSTKTVYRRARLGQLPGAFKVGHQWRIHPAPLMAHLNEQRGAAHAS